MILIANIHTEDDRNIEVILSATMENWKNVLREKLAREIKNGHLLPFKAKHIYIKKM